MLEGKLENLQMKAQIHALMEENKSLNLKLMKYEEAKDIFVC